jgi:hypothetical protein
MSERPARRSRSHARLGAPAPAGPLGADVRRLVDRVRLGFVASLGPDGRPRLSPKGSVAVLDTRTLVFADVASSGTVRNLLENPACEINVVDPMGRQGYRFRGQARILLSGPTFDRILRFYRDRGVPNDIHHMVLVDVEEARRIESPVYALGVREADVRRRWQRWWSQGGARPPGE